MSAYQGLTFWDSTREPFWAFYLCIRFSSAEFMCQGDNLVGGKKMIY